MLERRYGWDAAGNLITRVDQLRGTQAFRYDPTGRVIDYDTHGNVTRRRKGAHELAELSWNAEHQLAQSTVTRHGVTQTTRYEYDALGRRTRKRDTFGATEYLWDGDLMIERRRNNKSALFLYEPDSFVPLATVQYNETYWYHCDQIGAPMELTDADGRIVWAADYRVWGEATVRKTGTDGLSVSGHTPAPPPIEQPFRFQGQQFDEETGLHYNRFRYYDPGVGRFVSQDPIGLAGGGHLYQYAPNPTLWIDPLGLAKICCCGDQYVDTDARWREVMNDPNTPKSMRGWLQNQTRRVATGKQANIKTPPGYELAHRPRFESELGYDYSHADPMLAADHRGIQHRYWRKRNGCWSAKMPSSGSPGTGKLSLPKPGSLP